MTVSEGTSWQLLEIDRILEWRAVTGSVGWDHTIRLWETDTGKEILTKKIEELVDSVVFSSGGVPLAMGYSDRDIRLWAVNTGKSVLNVREHEGSVNSVALSLDGRLLASDVRGKDIRLWDVTTGKTIHKLNGDEVERPQRRFFARQQDTGLERLQDSRSRVRDKRHPTLGPGVGKGVAQIGGS